MTVTESKDLKKGTRVYWQGAATDSGIDGLVDLAPGL